MVETPRPKVFHDPHALASYVESLTGELARLARDHGLPTLAYILDMARLEARNTRASERGAERGAVEGGGS